MNRRVLGGGAIACSAVAMYGWVQPATPSLSLEACGDELANAISSWLSSTVNKQTQNRCSYQQLLPKIANAPDSLQFDLHWSQSHSNTLPNDVETLYSQLLKQSQAAASKNQLPDAIATVAGIPNNSRHHNMAKQLQDDWSRELLRRATDRYQKADLKTALSMLNAIPASSQRHSRAIELHKRWRQEAVFFDQAKIAKHEKDWNGVINALKSLEGSSLYYSPPAQALLQQALNNLLEPDKALLQTASVSAESTLNAATPVSDGVELPAGINRSFLAEAVPKPSDLAIDVEQALEWAQPPASSNPPKSSQLLRKLPTSSNTNPNASMNPPLIKQIVVPSPYK